MRSLLAVTLLLTPALLHGQGSAPSRNSTLQSKLTTPALLASVTSAPAASAPDTTRPLRVSTGVTAPKLIHSAGIISSSAWPQQMLNGEKTIVLKMIVNEKGAPADLQVVQSGGGLIDHDVLAAVSQYRYVPATLDGQNIAVPVRLEVLLKQ